MDVTLTGTLLSVCAAPYDFEDRESPGRRVKGISRSLWVHVSDKAAPVEVKFRDADIADDARQLIGSVVEAECEVRARNNRLVHELRQLTEVADSDGLVAVGQ